MLGATARLAAAKVISADAAVAAVFQTWMVFFSLEEPKETAPKTFLKRTTCFTPKLLWQKLGSTLWRIAAHHGTLTRG